MGSTLSWIAVGVDPALPEVVVAERDRTHWTVHGDALFRMLPKGALVTRLLQRVIDRSESVPSRPSPVPYTDVHPAVTVRLVLGTDADVRPTATGGGAAPSTPVVKPQFTARCTLDALGGRSASLRVGDYVDRFGRMHSPVIAKTIEALHTAVSHIGIKNNGYGYLDWDDAGTPTHPEKFLETFAQRLGDHTNVIRIIDVQRVDSERVTVYTPWYTGGTLSVRSRTQFGEAGLCHILRGACHGLARLNLDLGLIHADIKPANIFVDVRPHGLPVGVIGDIDDVFRAFDCVPGEHRNSSTNHYGAPFQHCDLRRDQVSLLVTVVETLAAREWHAYASDRSDRSDWKLHGQWDKTPGLEWWSGKAYTAFANILLVQTLVPAELLRRFRSLGFAPGAETFAAFERGWGEYRPVYEEMVRILHDQEVAAART